MNVMIRCDQCGILVANDTKHERRNPGHIPYNDRVDRFTARLDIDPFPPPVYPDSAIHRKNPDAHI